MYQIILIQGYVSNTNKKTVYIKIKSNDFPDTH